MPVAVGAARFGTGLTTGFSASGASARITRPPGGPRRAARHAVVVPARTGPRRPAGTNAAPTVASNKPPDAANALKPIVKRVRKVAAPTATGTAADGQGE